MFLDSSISHQYVPQRRRRTIESSRHIHLTNVRSLDDDGGEGQFVEAVAVRAGRLPAKINEELARPSSNDKRVKISV
jgi:hypothetical protein